MPAAEERLWTWRHVLIASVPVLVVVAGIVMVFTPRRAQSPAMDHPASEVILAGRAAIRQRRYQEALSKFAEAESRGELPVPVLFDRAQVFLKLGDLTAAEEEFQQLLQREPMHEGALELLSAMFRVSGRNWEIRPLLLAQFRQQVYSAANLAAVTSSDNLAVNRGPPEESQTEQFIIRVASEHDDLVAKLGRARQLLAENAPDEALALLREVVEKRPELLDAQARVGATLLDIDRLDEFQDWQRKLPDQASEHPDIWFVRGRWLEHSQQREGAARCYWEALRRFPDHPAATYRLAQMLLALGRSEEGKSFAHRASEINKVQLAIATGWNPPSNIEQLAERLEKMGRWWEALAWSVLTLEWTPHDAGDISWAHERSQRLRDRLRPDTPLVLNESNPALQIDLSDLPLPEWERTPAATNGAVAKSGGTSPLQFGDSAPEAGISFSYYNAADPQRAYMFEFSGGGVAVLDYDADGWPDLYLTQGCRWPVDPGQTEYTDRLFRNLGNGKFADVTEQAGIRDSGFGQGVAAGDIDNDGWPDLYVANIGRNQLLRNNGDGTFTDITDAAGIEGTQWTLSTLIADLNGDGAPDLYDVNYLGGPDVFTEVCIRNGGPTQCPPNQFPGEQDQLYQSDGEGRFQNVTTSAGVVAPDGKGMGVVAADFDGSRRLSLFISNDTTNNFFFLNQTERPGDSVRFIEHALQSGVAVGENGTAGSCMGIAVGDTNGDDRLDLFVTNFRDEANNLYVQDEHLLFADRIRQARLHDPGFPLEGWGAQFFDADLDGKLDLAVANGHLDDYPHTPGLTTMPTQVFRNVGAGRFAEEPATTLGKYFQTNRLGRALARVDWNRDGKPDFCVTHVDFPFALLTNQTPQTGHSLILHLRGTHSARDPIGALVRVRVGAETWTEQLTAGDGFQATNQRTVVFGLGDTSTVDELEIQWPSGGLSRFEDVAADQELICVEGRMPVAQSPSQSAAWR